MSLVDVNFSCWPADTEYNREVRAWMISRVQNQKCDVCGELVAGRRAFLWWCADRDIIFCSECAEHTISGLGRDLAELKGGKGHKDGIYETGDRYNPVLLRASIAGLQHKLTDYSRQIIELQDLLARLK